MFLKVLSLFHCNISQASVPRFMSFIILDRRGSRINSDQFPKCAPKAQASRGELFGF